MCYSPLEKRKGNWRRNASRNCFWDCYWARAGQLLVCYTAVFSVVTHRSSPLKGALRDNTKKSCELALCSFYLSSLPFSFRDASLVRVQNEVNKFYSPARQLLFWKFLFLKVPQLLRLFDDISHWSQSLRSSTDWNAKIKRQILKKVNVSKRNNVELAPSSI